MTKIRLFPCLFFSSSFSQTLTPILVSHVGKISRLSAAFCSISDLRLAVDHVFELILAVDPVCGLRLAVDPVFGLRLAVNPVFGLRLALDQISDLRAAVGPISGLRLAVDPSLIIPLLHIQKDKTTCSSFVKDLKQIYTLFFSGLHRTIILIF